MSIIYSIPTEELKEIVKNSKTYSEILRHFGLENRGNNHKTLKRRMQEENIDYSHVGKTFAGWNKGIPNFNLTLTKENALKEIFTITDSNGSKRAKRYLKRYDYISYQCCECENTGKWKEKPLSLELDHINGENKDNRLENLRWLCPNCHSQTSTFRGRKKKIHKLCNKCSKPVHKTSTYCRNCAGEVFNIRRVNRPTKELLEKLLWEKPLTYIAKDYDVSPTAIKRWLKNYQITNFPGAGYWQKMLLGKKMQVDGFEPSVELGSSQA